MISGGIRAVRDWEGNDMKTNMKMGLGVAALAATLTSGVFIGQALANQPHMEAALSALRSARGELMEAEHNKMGHRAEAIRLTNEAIHETEAGMEDAH
ncbi:MAG TPA: hypothetical protein VGF56_13445 [Rhizomicrobium sp.]|jgi:hypothetical protein